MSLIPTPYLPVIIIGGGQAGLCSSYYLKENGIEHLIIERNTLIHSWRKERWDSFCLVTPNHQCHLPNYHYQGDDPEGFMVKEELIAWFEGYIAKAKPPVREGVAVLSVSHDGDRYLVETSEGTYAAENVISAVGSYHIPFTPPGAEKIPAHITQIFATDYRNPNQVPAGNIAIVGSGQSGCQLAEEFHLIGRQVHLCLGNAPRSPRKYRGKDAVTWLEEMGFYDIAIADHPNPDKARNTNHYLTGRDGGHEIDLRKFASEGMKLYGYVEGIDSEGFQIRPDLTEKLDSADQAYLSICKRIDAHIETHHLQAPVEPAFHACWQPEDEPTTLNFTDSNITTIIWCIGFKPDFSFLKFDIVDAKGYPIHDRGISALPGLYFIGLPWQHTWGSARLLSVAKDAEYLVAHLTSRLPAMSEQ